MAETKTPDASGGIISNAINKITYKANEIAYDPAANAAAEERRPTMVEITSLPPNTQILLSQIKQAIRRFRGIIEARIEVALRRLNDEQSLQANEAYLRDLEALGLGTENNVKRDIVVDNTLYNKMVEVTKKYYLVIYSLILPTEISLDDFKAFLSASAPPFPGENGNEPGIKRAAASSFAKSFKDTIFGTGMTVLIILVCTFAGTLAANDAIGRSVFIRIVYFIYASIPIFTPFVFIYYIYRYIKGTRPKIYSYLPLIPNSSDNPILSYLLAPFSYIPDYLPNSKTQLQTKIYDIIASGFVWKEDKAAAPPAK